MEPGDIATRREVWRGQPWSALPTIVIADTPELLAVHLAVGAPFGFIDGHPLGVHSWSVNDSWQGIDVVMLHRPGDAYSVWFFGALGVYINLQDPFRRTDHGFDTFDHQLDIVIGPDGAWEFKDEEHLEPSIEFGRFTVEEVDSIRATGDALADMLDTGQTWWNPDWARWAPPANWPTPALRDDWASG